MASVFRGESLYFRIFTCSGMGEKGTGAALRIQLFRLLAVTDFRGKFSWFVHNVSIRSKDSLRETQRRSPRALFEHYSRMAFLALVT